MAIPTILDQLAEKLGFSFYWNLDYWNDSFPTSKQELASSI